MSAAPCADDDEQNQDDESAHDGPQDGNVGDELTGAPCAIFGIPIPKDESERQADEQAGYRRTQSLSHNAIDVALLLENVSNQQRRRIWKVVKILCETGQ